MIKLNTDQEKAVRCGFGPVLVIAGPGSGKTRVITHRITFLVNNLKVEPRKILVLSFTKASASEMKERFIKENEDIYDVNFGTIHSALYEILRKEIDLDKNSLITQNVQSDLIEYAWKRLDKKYGEKRLPELQYVLRELGRYREEEFESYIKQNNLGDYRGVKSKHKSLFNLKHKSHKYNLAHPVNELFSIYSTEKNKLNKIDFDDILYKCFYLLCENKNVLEKYQEQYDYILVDEFQDISRIQYEALKILAKPKNNFFVVGDDDQSIYGFRGANPKVMRDFRNDFDNVTEIFLSQNYRCNVKILELSKNLIAHNANRIVKEIMPMKSDMGKVNLVLCKNKTMQAKNIISEIKEKILNGVNPKEIGILCRSRFSFYDFVYECKKAGIDFYENSNKANSSNTEFVIKDIMAYMKLACNRVYRQDILRIINKPARHIYGLNLKYEKYDNMEIEEVIKRENDIDNKYLDELNMHIRFMKTLPPSLAIDYILNIIGYKKYINENVTNDFGLKNRINDEIDNLKSITNSFRTIKDFLSEYDENSIKSKQKVDIKGINLTTMHSSKGLEYEYVYLPDLNEGIIPTKEAKNEEDIEEERRLFYVAMTRAKKELNLYACRYYNERELTASRFLREIKAENII